VGSTFGLMLRLFLINKFKKVIGFNINNVAITNILASFFLGILVAFNLSYKNLLLFSVGFLGCLSTFSSFIYQLFKLLRERKYLLFCLHYIEVFILSFLCFFVGYFITSKI